MSRPGPARIPRLAAVAGALAAGLLTALALPPWGWWPLSFVGLGSFGVLADSVPARSRPLVAFAFGVPWFLLGMAWMWFLTVPGYLVAVAIFAALHAAAEAAVPAGPWRVLARPAAHSLAEAIRCSFPFGGVPLATIGIAQAGGPLLAVARFGGVIAITWVTWQLAALAASLVVAATGRGRLAPAPVAAAAALALVIVVGGAVGPDGSATGRTRRVALVQGGGEQGTRALDVPAQVVTDRHLAATARLTRGEGLDVVIWPENVVDVTDFAASPVRRQVADQAARLGVPIVIGITEDVVGHGHRVTNAQVVVDPDGTVSDRYDKVRRVPFGEYVPLRGFLEAIGAPVDQVPTNAVPGSGPAVLEIPGTGRVAVAISWEVFFSGRVRDGVRHGGELVVNPTNGASYTWAILQTQQIASSRLRAVETGRDVIQVAPTGFSAVIDHTGRLAERTAISEQAVLVADVSLRTGRTWYVSLADRPWYAALVLVAGASLLADRRRVPPADRREITVTDE